MLTNANFRTKAFHSSGHSMSITEGRLVTQANKAGGNEMLEEHQGKKTAVITQQQRSNNAATTQQQRSNNAATTQQQRSNNAATTQQQRGKQQQQKTSSDNDDAFYLELICE
jgi:Mg-chelatase subunit ChlI